MPRRREVPKREILPDPKYGNVELSKFMNVIMEGGKKASPSASFTVHSTSSKRRTLTRTRSKLSPLPSTT
jgi:ribosomal protein S7